MIQTKSQFNTEDNRRDAIISYLIWNKLAIKNLYNIDISRLKNNIDLIKNSLYPKSLNELINHVKNILGLILPPIVITFIYKDWWKFF